MGWTTRGIGWLLALAALIAATSSVRGQARSQPRTAQRAPKSEEPQAAAGDERPPSVARGAAAGNPPSTRGPVAAPGAARNRAAAEQPPQNLGPKAPFVLTDKEQQLLDAILTRWEQQSDKIKTFKCGFTRWEYDPTFGDPKKHNLKSEGEGYIKYKSPDRGEYGVSKSLQYNFDKRVFEQETENLDRWTCDGKAIFEFNTKKKQVIQRNLPPEMQGKAISDGPLPFVFGAKADQLKRRYWMRDVTPGYDVGKHIWLEARPKYQQDAANFDRATVVLNEADFVPYALRITLPGEGVRRGEADDGKQEANIAYQFTGPKVNDPLGVFDILVPRTPLGWKLVVEADPAESQPKNPPAASDTSGQAKRSPAPTRRK